MRAVSWNLFGLEDAHLDLRSEAAVMEALLGGPALQVLEGQPGWPPPEVLMFQEVVDRSLQAHLLPHLRAAGYTCWPTVPHPTREYYELIALRPPFCWVGQRVTPLDSEQGRELLEVEALLDGERWHFATAHLESMASGSRLRTAQARTIVDGLSSPALFGGDTNLREHEVDGLPDAFEACGAPRAQRVTRVGSRGTQRYDRFWARGLRVSDFRLLGRAPVTPDGQPPSDHRGISLQFWRAS